MSRRTLSSALLSALALSALCARRPRCRNARPSSGSTRSTGTVGRICPVYSKTCMRARGLPAIAAAIVRDGRLVEQATVGVMSFGSDEKVTANARFPPRLGHQVVHSQWRSASSSKRGKLGWDTRVGTVLKDVEMLEAYRDVTIEELLQHRGGLPAYTDGRPAGHPADRRYSGSPSEQRAAFLADALQQAPVGTPGQTALYSNAGYTLAGHMAELASGESWEALVRPSRLRTARDAVRGLRDSERAAGTRPRGFELPAGAAGCLPTHGIHRAGRQRALLRVRPGALRRRAPRWARAGRETLLAGRDAAAAAHGFGREGRDALRQRLDDLQGCRG